MCFSLSYFLQCLQPTRQSKQILLRFYISLKNVNFLSPFFATVARIRTHRFICKAYHSRHRLHSQISPVTFKCAIHIGRRSHNHPSPATPRCWLIRRIRGPTTKSEFNPFIDIPTQIRFTRAKTRGVPACARRRMRTRCGISVPGFPVAVYGPK